MRAQAEAVAVIVLVFIILGVFAFMIGARARLLVEQAERGGKSLNIYVSKTSNGLCISSSINTYVVIVEYNSTYARVIDSTVLKPAYPYCVSTAHNLAVATRSGLFTIDQSGRVVKQ